MKNKKTPQQMCEEVFNENPEQAKDFWGNAANKSLLVTKLIEKSNFKITRPDKALQYLKSYFLANNK